ncbi:hypothetical protein [Chromobacterium sphagni]|uniref:Uncharacterized protein n=1 Tax=Chromobacterium sphagni TaxID=1903179 RepID=A0A1S1X3C3_9NEIS|nr:hypothetical protein [Chromobacterium sphagni]OHX13981.1 hypothetical protein BI347_11010 [Chromobacterium sphagni]OHX20189.1 hypothetical protein BI344_06700 [Chromobacterium sphagni]
MIAPVQPWRWIRLEIGLIVNGGIQYALFIDHPFFWPALGLTTLLILLLLLWPSVRPAPSPPQPQDSDTQARYWRDVASHVYALLPLWAGHIALGREQIDDAACHLTSRFDGMLRQLGYQEQDQDDAAHAREPAETRLANALEEAPLRNRLAPVLEQLRQSGLRLEALAQETPHGQSARDEQIAGQVRQLLLQLEQVSQDLQAPRPSRRDDAASGFNLQTTAEDVLIHLQFQDRVSQILAHVQNDIWQLETMLHGALTSEDDLPAPPDTEAWLNALKNSYTTHEQRSLHNRDGSSRPPGPSDITFF